CARSKTCLNLISNPAYGKLLRSSSFRQLSRSQSFADMVDDVAFTSMMKDETLTKVVESGQFDELQRTAAKRTSSTTDKTYELGTSKTKSK
ncbi:MAG: hypothetical protein HKO89_00025, partial [Saprospiraceae bacterium]|nr:hypothetical protein [Saprospiraceae bacterium]